MSVTVTVTVTVPDSAASLTGKLALRLPVRRSDGLLVVERHGDSLSLSGRTR